MHHHIVGPLAEQRRRDFLAAADAHRMIRRARTDVACEQLRAAAVVHRFDERPAEPTGLRGLVAKVAAINGRSSWALRRRLRQAWSNCP